MVKSPTLASRRLASSTGSVDSRPLSADSRAAGAGVAPVCEPPRSEAELASQEAERMSREHAQDHLDLHFAERRRSTYEPERGWSFELFGGG